MRRIDERIILEKELLKAKKDLFRAMSIREFKAIQNRIQFLSERIKELNNER
jgi:hypothetical protein